MVEHSPQILTHDEKATTTTITMYFSRFFSKEIELNDGTKQNVKQENIDSLWASNTSLNTYRSARQWLLLQMVDSFSGQFCCGAVCLAWGESAQYCRTNNYVVTRRNIININITDNISTGADIMFFLHWGKKIIYVCIKTHHHRQHFYKDRHLDLTLNIALDYCTRDDTHLLTETIQHTNSDKSANSHTNFRAGSWRKKLATTTQLLLMQDSFIFFLFSQGLVEHILIIKTVDAKWSPSFTTIL